MNDPRSAALREFSRSLPMALLNAHQAVMAQFRPILRANGITDQQWRVLRAIAACDSPVRIGALARLTLVSAPSLTRIIRGLSAQNLIKRDAESGDQRAARISLAPAGKTLIDKVSPLSEARYQQIAQRLGENELEALYQALAELPRRLDDTRKNRLALADPMRPARRF